MQPNQNNSAVCGSFEDKPHAVVIELTQPITCEQAQELGKVLGAHGFTGKFVGGDIAQLCILGAKYKKLLKDNEQGEGA